MYVGIDERSLWLASGDKSLDRMKQSILDSEIGRSEAGPRHGAVHQIWSVCRFLEQLADAQSESPRQSAGHRGQTSERDEGHSDRCPGRKEPVEGLISTADLRKLAIEAFKEGNDTMTMSLERQDKVAKLKVQYDEGILRFIGKVASKFVKENLEDE